MIICVTSLARAGKDTFADYISRKYGFIKINMSDVLRDELVSEGKNPNKENMSKLGDEWRRIYGRDIVMRRTLEKAKNFDRAVIIGVRSIEEYHFMKNNADDVHLIALTADRGIRFSRKNELDPQTRDEFFARDDRDIRKKGLDKVMDAADFALCNNFSSPEEFYREIDILMKKCNND